MDIVAECVRSFGMDQNTWVSSLGAVDYYFIYLLIENRLSREKQ